MMVGASEQFPEIMALPATDMLVAVVIDSVRVL
jgi:hypothetical protein